MTDDERSASADTEVGETTNNVILTLRIPESTNDELARLCKDTGIKQAEILRLALKRGLPVLNAQLNPEGAQ